MLQELLSSCVINGQTFDIACEYICFQYVLFIFSFYFIIDLVYSFIFIIIISTIQPHTSKYNENILHATSLLNRTHTAVARALTSTLSCLICFLCKCDVFYPLTRWFATSHTSSCIVDTWAGVFRLNKRFYYGIT